MTQVVLIHEHGRHKAAIRHQFDVVFRRSD